MEFAVSFGKIIGLFDMAETTLKFTELADRTPQTASASKPSSNVLQDNRAVTTQAPPVQRNNTGMPDKLKSGIENLSGYSLDDVKVHYNSAKPAQLNAHAYAQGNDIHLGAGQEQHLPHEAWHVVQQKQGRVKATVQMKEGMGVNDDIGLEREADVMGARASTYSFSDSNVPQRTPISLASIKAVPVQAVFSATATNNFLVARNTLETARQHYNVFDEELEGNQHNWGFSNDTWGRLEHNVILTSNHIRGQGIADAIESLSWQVNNNPINVRGPGDAAGVDLRLFSSAGMGGQRMDFEVKHANSAHSVCSQIAAAVNAHGNNQIIKLYKNPSVNLPNNGDSFTRAARTYTFRNQGYAGVDQSATVQFYEDTDPTARVAILKISWA
jgi:hypothetical protein